MADINIRMTPLKPDIVAAAADPIVRVSDAPINTTTTATVEDALDTAADTVSSQDTIALTHTKSVEDSVNVETPTKTKPARTPNAKNSAEGKTSKSEADSSGDGDGPALPTARIRRIIKSGHNFGILGGDSVALISKSCELFLQDFCHLAYESALSNKRKTIQYADLSCQVRDHEKLEFLLDIVPMKSTTKKHKRKTEDLALKKQKLL